MATIKFRPRYAGRLPDPLRNAAQAIERHVFYLLVTDLPAGLPGARALKVPRTRWDIYRDVQASLLDKNCTPGTFHLKSHGITVVARAVDKIEEDEFDVHFADGQGMIDGAQTYRLIMEAKQNPDVQLPKNQYVKVEVLTRVPEDWVAEICGGLNTSIGGQPDSLLHLQDALAWIKDELKGEQYFKSISWSESERGVYDVRDILDVLTCFNTTLYPNAGGNHPVVAYESRSVVLSSFEQDFRQNGGAAFRRLRPLLKQMLFLYDTIRLELPILLERGGKAPADLIERAPKKPFEFPFLGTRATEQPARGAVLPVLAAFRWMVEDDEATKSTRWRGGFGNVLERWKKSCEALARQTTDKCRELDDGPDALGRSAAHWGALHKEVAFLDLMAKPTAPRSAPSTQADSARTGTGTA